MKSTMDQDELSESVVISEILKPVAFNLFTSLFYKARFGEILMLVFPHLRNVSSETLLTLLHWKLFLPVWKFSTN